MQNTHNVEIESSTLSRRTWNYNLMGFGTAWGGRLPCTEEFRWDRYPQGPHGNYTAAQNNILLLQQVGLWGVLDFPYGAIV